MKRISATGASRTFSELLNRVRYRGDSFVIERAGEAIGKALGAFDGMSPTEVRQQRHERFLDIGRTL